MIRVTASSRLHFGLLNVASDFAGAGAAGGRRFGGVGLMIAEPGLRLGVEPAAHWSAEGPLADRALAFARRFAGTLPEETASPVRLVVEHAPPEHVGLGTGTQLGLAVATGLAAEYRLGELPVADLARRVGRGLRSGIGTHGFVAGGLLVDGGKRSSVGVAPLLVRCDLPPDWRVIVALPPEEPGRHGAGEREAFAALSDAGQVTDRLCRLVLLDMLPALAEQDLSAFGEAVTTFNALVGEAFAGPQGGRYAGSVVTAVVEQLRRQGVRGVGQSSWGPAVFGLAADEEEARRQAAELRQAFAWPADRVFTTRQGQGATVVVD